jgi:hypothetical protein
MTEDDYAAIERRVIAAPARPVTGAPALDADLRQRETVEALEQACGEKVGEVFAQKGAKPAGFADLAQFSPLGSAYRGMRAQYLKSDAD